MASDNGNRRQILEALRRGEIDIATAVSALSGDQPLSSELITEPTTAGPVDGSTTIRSLQQILSDLLAAEIKMAVPYDRPDITFERYGFDSVMAVNLIRVLEPFFGTLSPALLFEYRSIAQLAGHFLDQFPAACDQLLASKGQTVSEQPTVSEHQAAAAPMRAQPGARDTRATGGSGAKADNPVVVGMAGRFPEARSVEEFWQQLCVGYDAITEIPSQRWDANIDFDPEPGHPGKSYTKWGSFIDGVDEFDNEFFRISPREAEYMDPQERLLLQTAWHALEDANLPGSSLRDRQVGVYVGVMYSHYQRWSSQEQLVGNPLYLGSSYASIANRLSYVLDLSGPSLAVDTMCSSSLTAIHLAQHALERGDIDIAIVGGVNLSIHPGKFVDLSQGRFASTDGRCHSFGRDGTGYGPGEGIAALVLARPEVAQDLGCRVHARLLGSAIGHGGKTSGYSTPSPDGQSRTIQRALDDAGVESDVVSYVEAHGTGTPLGDPIEVAGLAKVFGGRSPEVEPCRLGSLKSNIGHLEGAAGIAAAIKVILQIRHRQLVPTLHSDPTNPSVDVASAGMRLQHDLAPWSSSQDTPLVAGVSSFGAGGLNAHLIIGAPVIDAPVINGPVTAEAVAGADRGEAGRVEENVIVLSAASKPALRELCRQLAIKLRTDGYGSASDLLRDVAHTSRVGRDQLSHRLAVFAAEAFGAAESLDRFAADESVLSGRSTYGWIDDPDRMVVDDSRIGAAIGSGAVADLIELWVLGAPIDLRSLALASGTLVDLPLYPFARNRHWPTLQSKPAGPQPISQSVPPHSSSSGNGAAVTTITPTDAFVADHKVAGTVIVPGARLLELALTAVATEQGVSQGLSDVVFQAPIVVDQPVRISIAKSVGDQRYLLSSVAANGRTVDNMSFRAPDVIERRPDRLDIATLREAASQFIGSAECYRRLGATGLDYGPSLQILDQVFVTGNGVLAQFRSDRTADESSLTPVLDGAMQAIVGIGRGGGRIPFAMNAVRLYGKPEDARWVHANGVSADIYDLTITDEHGDVVAAVDGLLVRSIPVTAAIPAPTGGGEPARTGESDVVLIGSSWQELTAPGTVVPSGRRTIVIKTADDELARSFLPGSHLTVGDPIFGQPPNLEDGIECFDLGSKAAWNHYLDRVGFDSAGADFVVLGRGQSIDSDRRTERHGTLFAALGLAQALIERPAGHRARLLTVHTVDGLDGSCSEASGMSSFFRTVQAEVDRFDSSVLLLTRGSTSVEMVEAIADELATRRSAGEMIMRHGGQAWRNHRHQLEIEEPLVDSSMSIRAGGHYLITGGLGGVGQLLMRHLVTQHGAALSIVGRSQLSDERELFLDSLRRQGARVFYVAADVADVDEINEAVARCLSANGSLNGMFHLAGTVNDSLFPAKSVEAVSGVLRPKIDGARSLDLATADLGLDFFCLYSSASSVIGVPGQTDYAYANGSLNGFAAERNQLRGRGQRFGRTQSIVWPLWEDGGMGVSADGVAYVREHFGWTPLPEAVAFDAMERLLRASVEGEVGVFFGDETKILDALAVTDTAQLEAPQSPSHVLVNDGHDFAAAGAGAEERSPASDRFLRFLAELLAGELKMPSASLDVRRRFEFLGLESVMMMNVIRALEAKLGPLPKTLFFEHATIAELHASLSTNYRGQMETAFASDDDRIVERSDGPLDAATLSPSQLRSTAVGDRPHAPGLNPAVAANFGTGGSDREPIAIVGLAGRYPQADDVEQLWQLLRQGKDCITEIPAWRWDHRTFFDPDQTKAGKTYSKWGGFIDDVSRFDSLVFNISPREASLMDPQERLFLETVWHTLEDAGHRPEGLQEHTIGVFAGVMYSDFQLYGADPRHQSHGFVPASLAAAVANRVSYAFDFHGPSIGLNTMCSSSLTALHMACLSLNNGDCDLAVAGGVNAIPHPNRYLQLSIGKFAASDGRCRSFGLGGDGYVPGEGVGAVLLRPLSDALADGDQIYAVIRSTAVNHGGRTNGYTVPSPSAQADVVSGALQRAGLRPSQLDYLEAHGTGTELGDPIEISALAKALGTERRHAVAPPLPIGSIKSNIGHLEAAAGIAGLTKVLLQMRHHQLAPSLHAEQLNPHLELDGMLEVQRELAPWGGGQGPSSAALVAAVSAFGAGGSNAHVVVEEYVDQRTATSAAGPQLILLSARTEAQLRALASNFVVWLRDDADGQQPMHALDGGSSTGEGDFEVERSRGAVAEVLAIPVEEVPVDQDLATFGLDRVGQAQVEQRLGLDLGGRWSTVRELTGKSSTVVTAASNGQSSLPQRSVRTVSLADIAFTLQVGRAELGERLAFTVSTTEELSDRLALFAAGSPGDNGPTQEAWHRGRVGGGMTSSSAVSELLDGSVGKALLSELWQSGDLDRLGRLWVDGADIAAGDRRDGHRISLPLHPFAGDRFWVPEQTAAATDLQSPVDQPVIERIGSEANQATRPVDPPSYSPDPTPPEIPQPTPEPMVQPTTQPLAELTAVRSMVVDVISEVLELAPEEITPDIPHLDLGIDSVLAVEIVDRLGRQLKIELSPTDFFNHETVERFSNHVVEALSEQGRSAVAGPNGESVGAGGPGPVPDRLPEPVLVSAVEPNIQLGYGSSAPATRAATPSNDVAIIGLSGRFAGFEGPSDLWSGLVQGVDAVGEIPADRWDWRSVWDPDPGVPERTYSKWGSYLSGIDQFDPDFFGISHREARLMDPQQRVFMLESYRALESAGYGRDALDGLACFSFVGAATGDYDRYLTRNGIATEGYTFTGTHTAILASRAAYALNLSGPSLAVDTSCSSSLMAVHLGCEAIRSGQTDVALAGGVAALFTPQLHIYASKAKMLSPTGRCRAFDDSADGFVPGEGVGAVVLKNLERAIEDGDPIRAVISGSGANQDGRSNGITAPNEDAQSALEADVYRRFGIDPSHIGYVECHGTGTRLGDPIEIKALTRSFRQFTDASGYCALGSIKSNLGHTLTAAGIASLIKVVLCLENRTLVPTLHVHQPNRYIDFDRSPFFINTETRAWAPPVGGGSLTAAVSSFGFSGTNVHAVVRESPVGSGASAAGSSPSLFPFSAATDGVLRAVVGKMVDWLQDAGRSRPLNAIAATLATGRTHHRCRIAVYATSTDDLVRRLHQWLQTGQVADDDCPEALRQLGQRYQSGESVDWGSTVDNRTRRIAMPTYPFDLASFWPVDPVAGVRSEPSTETVTTTTTDPNWLGRPIAVSNDAGRQIYEVRIKPDDPVVEDHVVAGRPLLPAAGHISLVMAVVRWAFGDAPVSLDRAVFLRPLFSEDEVVIRVVIEPEARGVRPYEVQTIAEDGQTTVHSRGRLNLAPPSDSATGAPVDVGSISARCSQHVAGAEHYDRFDRTGIAYGLLFRTVQWIRHSSSELIAELVGSTQGTDTPPGLFDGAVQTVAALHEETENDRPHVPFAMDRIHFLQPMPEHCTVHVQSPGPGSCTISILSPNGTPCVRIEGMSYRMLKAIEPPVASYEPIWQAEPLPQAESQVSGDQGVMIIAAPHDGGLVDALANHHRSDRVNVVRIGSDGSVVGLDQMQPNRVYFVGPVGSPAAGDGREILIETVVDDAVRYSVDALFDVAKQLSRSGATKAKFELVVVTANVHAPNPGDDPREQRPLQAGAIGFARSLSAERPQWTVRTVDVDLAEVRRDGPGVCSAIAAEPRSATFDEVAVRGDGRLVRRLTSVIASAASGSAIRSGGTYLIAGGTGGIGYELACHLSGRYKANVVLVGRRAQPPDLDQMLSKITEAGGQALYLQGDITSESEMRSLVAQVGGRYGSLNGVFHSALTLQDASIDRMDRETLHRVLAPKIAGTRALAAAVQGHQLDFFTLFSSVQSFSGNPGQANYAAACRFKDAYAIALRQSGIPSVVVNWGYWGSVGVVSGDQYRDRMAELGVGSIEPGEGFTALEAVLDSGSTQRVLIKADRSVLDQIGVVERVTLAEPPSPAAIPGTLAPERAVQLVDAYEHLDRYGITRAYQAAVSLGLSARVGEPYPIAMLIADLGIVPEHHRLWSALMWMFERQGFITSAGDTATTTEAGAMAATADTANLAAEIRQRCPDVAAHLGLLESCADQYAAVLRGQLMSTEILFPGGSFSKVEAIYQGDVLSDALNSMLAGQMLRFVLGRDAGQQVRILEIGAGTGGTTGAVVSALQPEGQRVHYTYTDISGGLIRYGKKLFGDRLPNMDFRLLNIESAPGDQGFDLASYDAIVAANVLHATTDLSVTMGNVGRLLAPGGRVLLSETTAFTAFATLTFGLLPGWWLSKDVELRVPHSPLASNETWSKILTSVVGCVDTAAYSPSMSSEITIGQAVIVGDRTKARSLTLPAEITPAERQEPMALAQPVAENGAGSISGPAETIVWLDDDQVTSVVTASIADALGRNADDLDFDRPFTEYGLDSIVLVELVDRLDQSLGIELGTTAVFDHPTISELIDHISELMDGSPGPSPEADAHSAPPPGTGADDLQMLEQLASGEMSLDLVLQRMERK